MAPPERRMALVPGMSPDELRADLEDRRAQHLYAIDNIEQQLADLDPEGAADLQNRKLEQYRAEIDDLEAERDEGSADDARMAAIEARLAEVRDDIIPAIEDGIAGIDRELRRLNGALRHHQEAVAEIDAALPEVEAADQALDVALDAVDDLAADVAPELPVLDAETVDVPDDGSAALDAARQRLADLMSQRVALRNEYRRLKLERDKIVASAGGLRDWVRRNILGDRAGVEARVLEAEAERGRLSDEMEVVWSAIVELQSDIQAQLARLDEMRALPVSSTSDEYSN